jgi:hypothetical protein
MKNVSFSNRQDSPPHPHRYSHFSVSVLWPRCFHHCHELSLSPYTASLCPTWLSFPSIAEIAVVFLMLLGTRIELHVLILLVTKENKVWEEQRGFGFFGSLLFHVLYPLLRVTEQVDSTGNYTDSYLGDGRFESVAGCLLFWLCDLIPSRQMLEQKTDWAKRASL